MMGGLDFTNFVSGGLAGAALTLITQKVSEPWRVWHLSKSITATTEKTPSGYRVRISNHGKRAIERAIAYISVKYDKDADIVDGMDSAFINTDENIELNEDRLCWSIASPPDLRPVTINIYQGEKQALDLVRFDSDKIVIPSEQGWGDQKLKTRSRVNLCNKRYEGSIHIVAKNTLRRSFDLVIDASEGKQDVTLSPRKFISFLGFLIPWFTAKKYK
jgi:hypothetical protein